MTMRYPRTAVILCACSGIISEKIDWTRVETLLADHPSRPLFRQDQLACGSDELDGLCRWLQEVKAERVVVAACSPREHQATFRGLLSRAGINPWFLQLVNVREQGAWVTEDAAAATLKATRLIRGALERVNRHRPLAARSIPVHTRVAVVGAGPAGMQAALTLARAGREVVLIEKEPMIGGLPVRYDELFPNLECGPCLLEPVMGELLHGPESEQVTLLTLSEVTAVKGSFGNWILSVRQKPRFVDVEACIGCMICQEVCPERRQNGWNRAGELAAIGVPFAGALPNLPHLDTASCRKFRGEPCEICSAECPVEGALDFEAQERELELEVGAIVLATGAEERPTLPAGFAGRDLMSAYSFERLIATNGATGGDLVKADGSAPVSLVLVQCAGSLDAGHTPYCSGVCCREALKLAHLAAAKVEGLTVTRLIKEQSVPGLEAGRQLHNDHAAVVRYGRFDALSLEEGPAGRVLKTGEGTEVPADMVVFLNPVLPGAGTAQVAELLELPRDGAGFLGQLHTLAESCAAPLRGVYLAGSCRGPGDVREAFATGTAAAGLALSALVPGRDLVIEPEVATVRPEACAGCRTCLKLCPYRAIEWDDAARMARVNDLLCRGCGTCVAGCPSAAIDGLGFTRDMLRAEIKGVLS
ncbi:heterodisulfide reductase subunit A [Geomonas limicola]|uniref:Heterodisulfide reductase subunit A n=1 Tax=Geomonas limicola TaxID=2740186 RepID=A0A6V8N6E2_9BACT|nr:4Fe-4S dicluster domain-containing protein [Geomonas limicola]GFO67387.1 heterodisulfide reductase subunit A [Geomonas limicola]